MKRLPFMKYFILLFVTTLVNITAFAQDDAPSLTKEGNTLSNQKSYVSAITKYKAALAVDADYAPANYQLAYTLNVTGKGLDGIPYLQKVFKSTTASANLVRGAYLLAGGIYDQNRMSQKAITTYQEGISVLNNNKEVPATKAESQPLFYNLSLAYFHYKQYEKAALNVQMAIMLDPKDASSQRIYALANFHQNKRAEALLGLCSFILLEPNTARSAEAYGNIQHILQGGALKPEPGQDPFSTLPETIKLNQAITQALKGFATRRYASQGDLLTAQLKAIFIAVNSAVPKDGQATFFPNYYATYFYKLAQTDNIPAFARFISQGNPESLKWIKANAQPMADLDTWVKSTGRGF